MNGRNVSLVFSLVSNSVQACEVSAFDHICYFA